MKKLMVALSAVALALGARADGITFPVGECFNDATVVPSTFTTPGDSSISDVSATFSKKTTIGTTDMWRDEDPEKNLAVKTKLDAPTFYNLAEAQTMPGSGKEVTPLYFDSLVKFTYCDEDATVPTGSNAKLMVWVKEDEEAGTTNLMVTAGFLQADVATPAVKNYNCGPLADYGVTGPDDWCRLTIKAKGDITSGGLIPGFVVCVNGTPVTIAALPEGNRDIGEAGSAADSLNAVDSFWHAENHLFPSLVNAAYTISAVGFAGQGAVDDISFAKTEPTLANGTTTFCADKAVASITWPTDGSLTEVKVGDKAMTLSDGAVSVPAGEPVVVAATAAEGWMITNGLGTVSIPADGVNAILTAEIKATVTIDGTPTTFATVAEAIAKIGSIDTPVTKVELKLADGYDQQITLNNANIGELVIDLAGQTLSATPSIMISNPANTLTITNSTPTVGKVQGAVMGGAGTLNIQAGEFNGTVGATKGTFSGGSFATSVNTKAVLDARAPADYEFVDNGKGYYELQEKPKTFTVTVEAAKEHTKVTVTSNSVAVAFAETYTGIVDEDTFVVTYTADENYEFAGGETMVEFTLDEDGEKATAPEAQAKTFAITYEFTGVEEADKVNIVNSNPATYTFGVGVDSFADASCEGYKFTGWDTTSIGTEESGAKTITGTFEKQGGWDPVADPKVTAGSKGITGDLAVVSFKDLSIWAQANDVTFAAGNMDAYKNAFLLNCAPGKVADEAAAFKITAITQESDGSWTVTAVEENTDGKAYNGQVVIKGSETLEDAEWDASNVEGPFFKAFLEVKPAPVDD